MTALQLHILKMKTEIHHMYQNDIRFGQLLKLIREANALLLKEKKQIQRAYVTGFADGCYNVIDKSKISYADEKDYYHQTYEKKTEGEIY